MLHQEDVMIPFWKSKGEPNDGVVSQPVPGCFKIYLSSLQEARNQQVIQYFIENDVLYHELCKHDGAENIRCDRWGLVSMHCNSSAGLLHNEHHDTLFSGINIHIS